MADNLFQMRFEFNATIIRLNEDLGRENLIDIIFLSREFYSGDYAKFKEPIDVFQKLWKRGYISEQRYGILAEIIWRIGRKDLVKKYLVSNVKVYGDQLRQSSLFSPYRLMLHELCQQMVDRSLKLLTVNLNASRNDLSRITTPQHLFIFMENQDLLSPQNDTKLIEWIAATKDDYLYEVLEKYGKVSPKIKRTRQFVHESLPLHSNTFYDMHQPRDMRQINRGIGNMQMNESDGPLLESYPMRASPRGLCVIFSNTNFHKNKEAYGAKRMDDREGGDVDAADLRDTWAKLDFSVQIYKDQPAAMIERIMYGIGRETDHTNYDAFVCCILSHGKDGGIYGSDGVSLQIKELVNSVKPSQCKSLVGKPKLFFVQACQGGDRQEGSIEDDIETDSPHSIVSQRGETPYVPNEADILISYATVSGFVSYRSKSSGSFYVQSLCNCLDKYANRYDLMSILTAVNKEVSEKSVERDNGTFKQVPQPQMTLRKLVHFC